MATPETELKFALTPEALARLSQHPALQRPTASKKRLKSVYYDTRTFRLKDAGFGLRVRSSGGRRIQTLKSAGAAGPIARQEWEAEIETESPDRALLKHTPAADVLSKNRRLAPVFATEVDRTTRLWIEGPNIVEISVDQGEIVAGARRTPLSEMELELKAGEPKALFVLANSIVSAVPLRLSLTSKSARGYRLASNDGQEARKAEPIDGSCAGSAADSFRVVAWNCLDQIVENAEVLAARRATEALHQMRVGLRRLRAAFTVYRDMLAGADLAFAKRETKWLAGELDRARDLDVFIETSFQQADASMQMRDAYAALGGVLLKAQSEAYDRAVAAVGSPRYAQLLLRMAEWLEVGDRLSTSEPVVRGLRERPASELAAELLDRLYRKVAVKPRKLAERDDAQRHKLRIKAKKLRYATTFFADAIPAGAAQRKFAKAVGKLQDALGELQDNVAGRDLMHELVAEQPGHVGFAAGLILGDRECRTDDRQARGALKALRRRDRYWR